MEHLETQQKAPRGALSTAEIFGTIERCVQNVESRAKERNSEKRFSMRVEETPKGPASRLLRL